MRFTARLAFVPLLVAACSSDPDTSSVDEKAEVSCDISTLAWNLHPTAPQTCAGPWQYQEYKDCSVWRPSLSCNDTTNANDPNRCSALVAPASTVTSPVSPACTEQSRHNPSYWAGKQCYWASTYNSAGEHRHEAMKTKRIYVCKKWSSDGECIMQQLTTVANETCPQHAQEKVNYYHSHYMGGADGTANFGAWVVSANEVQSNTGFYCDYDLYNAPTNYGLITDTRANPVCGGSWIALPDVVTYNGCFNPGKPPQYTCGDLPAVNYTTTFGQSRADALGQNASVDPTKVECLTAENLDLPTGKTGEDPEAMVRAKYTALRGNYDKAVAKAYVGVDNTGLEQILERNLKLLFETYGEYLTVEQRDAMRKLYAADDNLPACGADFVPPATNSCDAQDEITPLDRQLEMCTRLQSKHVHDVKDKEDIVNACIDVADQVGVLRAQPVECAFAGYHDAWNHAVTEPLGTRFEKLVDLKNSAAKDVPETQMRLRLLGRWYDKTSLDFYPVTSSDLQDPLVLAKWRESSKLTASFWRGIYRQLFGMADQYAAGGSATPVPAASDIEAAAHDSLVSDRTILTMLYPPAGETPPLRGAPLLLLTSDAFQAMSKRLQDISVYHDMGCSYLGCANGRNDSETAYLYRFFGNLADATELSHALVDARAANKPNAPVVVRPEWLTVFDQLAKQHRTFEVALCDAANIDATACDAATYAGLQRLLETAPTKLPIAATALGSIVQDAIVRWDSYRTSGMLDPSARNKLAAGIQQAQIDSVLDDLRQTANTLSGKTATYGASMQTLAGAYLQDIAARNKVSDVEAQIKAKQDQLARQTADISGLRAKIAIDTKLWGTFLDSYKTVTDVDGNALVQTASLGTFAMNAASARASGPLPKNADVSTLNAAPSKYTVAKGDIIHATVTGNWSPTCMMQYTGGKVAIPGKSDMTVDFHKDPLIGPEGFTLQLSEGSLTSHANNTSTTGTVSTGGSLDASICTGVKTEAGAGWSFIVIAEARFYVDMQACAKMYTSASLSYGESWSDTNQGSSSASLNASSGVRLPNTPFPDQPAGSVLLVYTEPGDATKIIKTEVMQRQHAAIAPANADVYIVDNDITSPLCSVDTSNQLTVTLTKMENSAQAAQNVKGALEHVLDTLTAQSDAFVAQGSFSGADQTSLRSAAISAISSTDGCNCNFSAYPDPIKSFFYAWIDHEIAVIDKKVQIYNLTRANNALLLDAEALSQDLVYADTSGHIASMLPGWSLRNLDMELLRAEVRKLLKSATYDLYPILKLRFPAIFDGLSSDEVLVPQIQTLVNAHWDDPVDNLAHAAYDATQALLDATSTINVHQHDLAITTVGLQFTRPGLTSKYTMFPYADDARAKAVWDQIVAPPHVVTFTVTPEDLYRVGGGTALSCTQEAPVIRDLAVVITGQDTDTTNRFNPLYWYGPTTASPTMQFPVAKVYDQVLQRWNPGELQSYTLADSGWQAQLSQFLFADSVTSTFAKFDEKRPSAGTTFTTARGLSPFTQFTIDFSSFYAADKMINGIQPLFDPTNPTRAKQVTLVMRLESRLNSPTLDFLPTCH